MTIGSKIANDLEPEAGWWNSSTGETIADAADLMIDAGMSRSLVVEILSDVTNAMSAEYGD